MPSLRVAVGVPLGRAEPETANVVVAWIVALVVLAYLAFESLRPWPTPTGTPRLAPHWPAATAAGKNRPGKERRS